MTERNDPTLGMADLNINKDNSDTADASTSSEAPTADLATVVDDLLSQLSTKFTNISSDLLAKMDEMSRRLDNLEASIQASSTPRPDNEESK